MVRVSRKLSQFPVACKLLAQLQYSPNCRLCSFWLLIQYFDKLTIGSHFVRLLFWQLENVGVIVTSG